MNQEQIKSLIQLLFGAGGPAAALILSYGVPSDKLNLWVNLAVAIIPPLVVAVWKLVDKTDKNIIAQAAAGPGVHGSPIAPTARGGAAAAADDKTLPTVQKPA